METPEQRAQNAKFGYKAPESVYKKHDPKASMVGSGKFFEQFLVDVFENEAVLRVISFGKKY